jgi:hypothetical protein
MTSRQRMQAALAFRPPGTIPLQIYAAAGGLYEHGQKLLDLIRACGHDFGNFAGLRLPEAPPPAEFDPDGTYHAIRTDDWGVTWEYRLFGVWGHPLTRPLDDWAKLPAYRPPLPPPLTGADLAAAAAHRQRYYLTGWGGELFERMRALRRYEDVLMDLALDTPEINRLADLILENMRAHTARSLAADVDAVCVADDFGTGSALMISPELFRHFFKPRYAEVFAPIRKAGKRIFFHSCGQIDAILEDLAELGVSAVWPQLPVFDLPTLARRCRDLGLAVQLHPDRGDLMQRGTPGQVRDYVLRMLDVFRTAEGGSWLYLEIDPGFPWANVEALFATAMELRQ